MHFHVPVFLDDLGAFATTRYAIEEQLAFHREHRVSRHLEIETYTWDVLPAELKHGDIVEYVVARARVGARPADRAGGRRTLRPGASGGWRRRSRPGW